MENLQKRLKALKSQADDAADKLSIFELNEELDKLRGEMNQADFWQDQKKALVITKREAELAARVKPWNNLKKDIAETAEMLKLADNSMSAELEGQISDLEKKFESFKKELRFKGKYDDRAVILSIYAGAGGTDAQDWAQMLHRMYVRWADSQKLTTITLDQSSGEEAGLKSLTLRLEGGRHLFGKLAGENGVHRLVRLSPYNADNLRQTSFAKIEVLPVIEKPEEVAIDDKDLNIDVFRASGHGGQSVNTTDSAVRITHIPTGISVAIQNERSQIQNKETALAILRSRLLQLQLQQHAKTINDLKGPAKSAEWGNQIRNYVLHPYKQVKDLRSGYESSDPQKVLNGDLDPLIDAWLEFNVGN